MVDMVITMSWWHITFHTLTQFANINKLITMTPQTKERYKAHEGRGEKKKIQTKKGKKEKEASEKENWGRVSTIAELIGELEKISFGISYLFLRRKY